MGKEDTRKRNNENKKGVFDAGQLKLRQTTAAVRVGGLFCSNQITAGGPVPALASEVRRTGHECVEQPFKWVLALIRSGDDAPKDLR